MVLLKNDLTVISRRKIEISSGQLHIFEKPDQFLCEDYGSFKIFKNIRKKKRN